MDTVPACVDWRAWTATLLSGVCTGLLKSLKIPSVLRAGDTVFPVYFNRGSRAKKYRIICMFAKKGQMHVVYSFRGEYFESYVFWLQIFTWRTDFFKLLPIQGYILDGPLGEPRLSLYLTTFYYFSGVNTGGSCPLVATS
jgi:hypothetical protein